jgi:hypothetical protein
MRSVGNSAAHLGVVIAAALLTSGCDWPFGPSASAAGNWTAYFGPMNSLRYELSLNQQSDQISGVACGGSSFATAPPGFRDAPVSGSYPNVRFTTPSEFVFSGKFEADRNQIAGDLGPAATPLRFNRAEGDGRCSWWRSTPGS